MKSLFLFLLTTCFAFAMVAQNVDITFEVDMSEQTVDVNGVHIAGSFQGWLPDASPLTDMGSGIWSITASIPENTSIEFKFVNGNAWGLDELVPVECAVSGNRTFNVGTANESVPVVCFASCVACPPVSGCTDPMASNYNNIAVVDDGSCVYAIDFSLDMSQYAGVFTNPEVNGSWDGFTGGVNLLSDPELDNVFEGTVNLPLGTYEFKFALDNWNDSESFNGNETCVVNTSGTWNRELIVTGTGAYSLVCWNSCAACVPIAPEVRISEVNTDDNLVTLTNFGNATQDVSSFYFCNFPEYAQISALVLQSGSPFLAPGASVQYAWLGASGSSGECALYTTNTFEDSNAILDYMQWVSGPQQRSGVAVTAGVWDDSANYVLDNSPYTFNGGSGDYGSTFWSGTIPPSAYNIIFSVDMNQETVSPNGVHLAGSFNDPNLDGSVINASYPQWDPAGLEMTDGDLDGVYEVSLILFDGVSYEFKYVNGDAWGEDEEVSGACVLGGNRLLVMNGSDQTISSCFASCDACPPANADVTFKVDLSEAGMTPDGVGLATSLNGFDPSINSLTDVGNGIWEVTLAYPIGTNLQYFFANGALLSNLELVPMECGVDDGNGGYYRDLTVPAEGLVLDLVCFGECSTCATSVVDVTFEVDMSLETISPDGVFIAGSFQLPTPWTAGVDQMTDAGLGIYTYTASVPRGTTIEYKYLNGLTFAEEELVPLECGVDNGFGGYNRSFDVGFTNETIPVHCYASCTECVILPVDVTFVVDMSNEVVSVDGVHIAGDFQGWDPAATQMADIGGGLYSYTAMIAPNSTINYKFINGNAWGLDEVVPAECETASNRQIQLGTADFTVPTVCFAACQVCNPPMVDVTFQVDMSLETVNPLGVHLAGSFQGWDPAATLMTNQGAGIWSVTVSLQENSSYEYKFINGDSFLDEESVPVECALGANRAYTSTTSNETLPLVCFSACSPCVIPQVSISFRVDMANETISPEGVHLVGNFQGWDPTTTPMNPIGYGIYEYTVLLDGFTTYYYKFVNGDEFGEDELVPAPCAVENGFGSNNRELLAENLDVVLPIVCYEECQACSGCTNPFMVEFNPFAIADDGSCANLFIFGCTYSSADNYNPSANDDDGSCILTAPNPCPEDLNMDGVINAADLLSFLGVFGSACN